MKKLITYFYAVFALAILCGTKSFAADAWERINSPEGSVAYSLYSTDDGILLMGTGQGINWSSDGGENWIPAESESALAHLVMYFAEDSKGALYAGGAEGLFRSTDKGQYWDLIKETRMAEIIEIDEEDNLYLATFIKDAHPKLLFSSNSGVNWINRTPPFDSSWSFMVKAVSDDLLIASADRGLMFSTDKGMTWEKANGIEDTLHISCVVEGDSVIIANTFYNDQNTGVFRSPNGSDWQRLATYPAYLDITQITYDPFQKSLYAIGWSAGILKSVDNGITWTDFNQGIPENEYISEIIFSNDGYMYASGSNNLYRRRGSSSAGDRGGYPSGEIAIAPNPAYGDIRVELPVGSARPISIELYDIHGSKISALAYRQISEFTIEAGISTVSPGFYLLKVQTQERAYVKPVIIPGK
ncbi:MAG: T9SS type A sorting domain-containing protein [Chloroflexota bacterium]